MQDSANMPDETRLLALLEEQRGLYDRLRLLSERQRNLISGDRPEMLLDILRDRQLLVNALARVNESLSPYRRSWESIYAGLSAEVRERVTTLLEEINSALRLILQSDQEDGALLAARKQSVSREIEEIGGARTANAAYARQSSSWQAGGADLSA